MSEFSLVPSSRTVPISSLHKLLLVAVVFLVAATVRLAVAGPEVFTSDAADYVRASWIGLWPLYTEQRSTPVWDLVRLRSNPEFRDHPWDFLARRGDDVAIRHFHVPGLFYLLSMAHSLSLSEAPQRAVFGLMGAATCGLLTLLLLTVRVWWPLAVSTGLLAAVDQRLVYTDVTQAPNPHTPYLFLIFVLMMLVAVRSVTDIDWLEIPAAVIASLCLLTFELAAAIIGALCLAVIVGLRLATLKAAALRAAKLLGICVACLLVFWPGGFIRGDLALCYGVMFGNVALKRAAYYGQSASSSILRQLFGGRLLYAVVLMLLLIAVLVVVRFHRDNSVWIRRLTVLFGAYSVFALGFGIAGRFAYDTYTSHVLLSVLLVGGFCAHLASMRIGRWFSGLVCIVLLLAATVEFMHGITRQKHKNPLDEVVANMRTMNLRKDAVVLINDRNDASTMFLYFPQNSFAITETPAGLKLRHPEMQPAIQFAMLHTGLLDRTALAQVQQWFEPSQSFGRENETRLLARRRTQ